MRSRHEQKIRDGHERGTDRLAGAMGDARQAREYAAGEMAEFRLASPMALAITERRLLVFLIGSPIGLGIGGQVKELVSAVSLGDVDAIEIRRLAIGKVVDVTVRGVPIRIEATPSPTPAAWPRRSGRRSTAPERVAASSTTGEEVGGNARAHHDVTGTNLVECRPDDRPQRLPRAVGPVG